MRRICYSVAASLDGYVAGPGGEYDWIVMDPEIDFTALFARFDTLLMGRRTYEVTRSQGQGGGMPGVASYVVSRTLRPQDHKGVTIIGENLADEVAGLRAREGKDIWLFGGGVLFRSLVELGLVDTVEVAVVPVLLGGGVPLLPATDRRVTLRLAASRVYQQSGIVNLEYEVVPNQPAKKPRARRAARRA
jgi:dihydrofolate reductase